MRFKADFFKQMPILFNFLSGLRNVIYFHVRQFEMQKNAFTTSPPLPAEHHAAKNKDIDWKLCMLVDGK